MIAFSAQDIQEARRQRRAIRAQTDFIPLGQEGHNSSCTSNHNIRGSDEDGIDDDDDKPDDYEHRIAFAPRLKNIRERILEKLGMAVKNRKLGKLFELFIYIFV